MCTHSRFIYNPYSRKKVLVNCGKCPACLQAKANARTARIKNNVSSGTITLFVTLTYSNDYVPYIKVSDLRSQDLDINVYRNASCRWTYSRSKGYSFKKDNLIDLIKRVYVPFEFRCDSEFLNLRPLNGLGKDKIGVCLTSDFQNFIKRLRQILKRNFNYEYNFSYFYCSELGSHTKRPHFHTLIFIRKNDEALFRNAIIKAWPFADSHRTEKYVEIARNAAAYVSSYVNCHIGLSSIMQVPEFKPSHNYSQGFGVSMDCFSLDSLLEKVDRRNLYYYRQQKYDGESAVTPVPIPVYVIDRFFPRFKGLGWFSKSSLQRIIIDPASIYDEWHKIENPIYDFTPRETYQIFVRLTNAFDYFHRVTGLSRFDYFNYYWDIWLLHFSTVLRDSYKDIEDILDFRDFYSNAVELSAGFVDAPTLPSDVEYEIDPNNRRDILVLTSTLLNLFDKYDKNKKVVNYCMSACGHNV